MSSVISGGRSSGGSGKAKDRLGSSNAAAMGCIFASAFARDCACLAVLARALDIVRPVDIRRVSRAGDDEPHLGQCARRLDKQLFPPRLAIPAVVAAIYEIPTPRHVARPRGAGLGG